MTSENPLVSVIIPNYNYGKYLIEALNSLLAQDYENWEAIIVDNHSTDNTDDVYAAFSIDSRIRLLKIHNGGSIARSRNEGIREASGQIIAFLDSDDSWKPSKLRHAVEAHLSGADIVYHDLLRQMDGVVQKDRGTIRSWHLNKPILRQLLRDGNALLNSSVSINARLIPMIGLFSESLELAGAEDYEYWLRCAQGGKSFSYLPLALGTYRIHGASMSRKDMSGKLSAAVRPYRETLEPRSQRRLDATIAYTAGRYNYLSGEFNVAQTKLKQVLFFGMLKFKVRAVYMMAAMHFSGKGKS